MKKKIVIIVSAILAVILIILGATAYSVHHNKVIEKNAAISAKAVLDYTFSDKSIDFGNISNDSKSTVEKAILNKLSDKQRDFFSDNDDDGEFYLQIDGSNYTANAIIRDYAKAYLNETRKLSGYKVKSVSVKQGKAHVKAVITPIAALSEAHPIGEARSQIFGGLDNDTIIRKSQNKNVKQINRLITLKLFAYYYGNMNSKPVLADKEKTINFTLSQEGNKFVASTDTLVDILKASRMNVYGK